MKLLLSLCLILSLGGVCSAQEACPRAASTREILDCALRLHPDVRVARAGLASAQEGAAAAAQRPNPELASQAVSGGSQGNRFSYAELNFAHVFELGGKRPARIAQGEAGRERAQAEELIARENAFSRTLLALYRLRQIRDRLALLEDALSGYKAIVQKYSSRPALTPEQSASRRVFQMASSDLELKRSALNVERDEASRTVELAIGRDLETGEPLPGRPDAWPPAQEAGRDEPAQGGNIAEAASGVTAARAESEAAGAVAWPDLRLGPTLQTQNSPGQSFNAAGFNLAVGLPFYHRNAAGRRQAARNKERAALAMAAVDWEQRDVRGHTLTAYRLSVAALSQMPSDRVQDEHHREIESLFERGGVPAALLLESHRQRLDMTASRDELELSAVGAYARLAALRGKLTEGVLP